MKRKHDLCNDCGERPVGAIRIRGRWRKPKDDHHTLCRKCYQAQIDGNRF